MPSVTKRMRVRSLTRDFQPDLVTHHLAQRRPHFLRHALGQHPRRQPARLEHHDLALFAEQAVAQQDLRNLGGFARPGRRLHDQSA